MSNLKITRDYQGDFDPDWYLATYYKTLQGSKDEGDLLTFFVDSLHELFAPGNIKGEKLLDIGTGPTVHSVISASRHVSEIHLSDFADQNRAILQKWRDGEPNVVPIFEYLIGKENKGVTLDARVTELRAKVTNIHPIDLRRPQPIENLACKYDVITSSLCLEAAARTTDEYASMISKVADMLNLDGHFVMVGVLRENFYRVADCRFDCLGINSDEVKRAVTDAGFVINTWREFKNEDYNPRETNEVSDFEGLFAMTAQKKL